MRIKTFIILLFMISIYSVSAQKGYSVDLDIKTEPGEKITLNETAIGLTVFGSVNEKTKIKNTFKYRNLAIRYGIENYDLQNQLSQFKGFENSLEVSHQLTEKTKLNFEIKPTANFQDNFNVDDVTLFGGLEISHSLNSDNKISVGVKRTNLFGQAEILPTFSFYHRINTNAYLEVGFPNSVISYSNSIRNKFSVTNNFNGNYYNLDQPRVLTDMNTGTKVSFSQMTSALEYERNMDTNWFVSLKGGYNFNKNYTLKNNNEVSTFDFNINNGYLFNIGIKYKH
ncbi:MAG: DUF6268 family outer membrane beta-barrel protein [Flavobacterium sp.]|nr:DUF6268 family outer membrane beta-barrel protein [Flavobacterium sp.]